MSKPTADLAVSAPVSPEVLAIAVDRALVTLTAALVKKGLIEAEELSDALMEASGELVASSTASPQVTALLGASLAVGRLSNEVSGMARA